MELPQCSMRCWSIKPQCQTPEGFQLSKAESRKIPGSKNPEHVIHSEDAELHRRGRLLVGQSLVFDFAAHKMPGHSRSVDYNHDVVYVSGFIK